MIGCVNWRWKRDESIEDIDEAVHHVGGWFTRKILVMELKLYSNELSNDKITHLLDMYRVIFHYNHSMQLNSMAHKTTCIPNTSYRKSTISLTRSPSKKHLIPISSKKPNLNRSNSMAPLKSPNPKITSTKSI